MTGGTVQVHRIADRIVIAENGAKILDAAKESIDRRRVGETILKGGRQARRGCLDLSNHGGKVHE